MDGSCFSCSVAMEFYGTESTKKDWSFFTAFFAAGQSCHCHNVLVKGHFRACMRHGAVHLYSQSESAGEESQEREQEDGVLLLALASPQRMTLAESLNLFEPQFSHL